MDLVVEIVGATVIARKHPGTIITYKADKEYDFCYIPQQGDPIRT
jgi:hypothetical protein